MSSCVVALRRSYLHTASGLFNAYRACLGKIGRMKHVKQYQVRLMRPDGSTIMARCTEPLFFVQLPVDVKLLNEDQKRLRMASRKTKIKIVEEEIMEDNFDFSKYANHWKSSATG